MLHFRFSMPLHFMMLYGSVLLLMVFVTAMDFGLGKLALLIFG